MTMVSGTREWAVAEVNCSVGCPYGCRYCYARTKALKDNVISSVADWVHVRRLDGALARDFPLFSGQVMFPASHDIVPENLEYCLLVISRLLAKGNRVLIVSKPSPVIVERLCNEFEDQKKQILFRFTITARDPDILDFWESGAPGYEQRRESLQGAAKRGFATSVSVEPMLDAEDICQMVEELSPDVSHSLWIGLMNKISERVVVDSDRTRDEVARIEAGQSDENITDIYDKLKKNPLIRWKESIKKVVGLPEPLQAGLDI